MPCREEGHRRNERGSLLHKLSIGLVALVFAVAVGADQGLLPRLHQDRANRESTGVPPATISGIELPRLAAPQAVMKRTVGPKISPASLRSRIAKSLANKAFGPHLGLAVADLESGQLLAGRDQLVTPASTLKLLTCLAALEVLGPDHRFTTKVVSGARVGQIVLVGGGDPLLTRTATSPAAAALYPARATLQDLARHTAAHLLAIGAVRATVRYDASLFTGAAVNRAWEPSYVPDNVVSPISALWVDEGREVAGYSKRVSDPALAAALDFQNLLRREGVKVVGEPTSVLAAAAAEPIAEVESAPLEEIVTHVLEVSDNEGAETLLRAMAIASGRPGSAANGVAVMRTTLATLGIDIRGATIHDGSGLSRHDRIPVGALISVLEVAASPEHPDLRAVVSGLPVAGFNGSLADRFYHAKPGRGLVRAKTGTLTGVHGLAGIVMTEQGRPLVFVAIADHVRLARTLDAQAGLDRLAATLATCGCT